MGTPPSCPNQKVRERKREKRNEGKREKKRGISSFCRGTDQSLENTDSYPAFLDVFRLYEILFGAGWLDISREACRIGSGDKTSDLSSRERKRARRIKGQKKKKKKKRKKKRKRREGRGGGKTAEAVERSSRELRIFWGLSTDLIGFLGGGPRLVASATSLDSSPRQVQ